MAFRQLVADTLIEMDRSVAALGNMVPAPQAVPFKDGVVFRHVEMTIEQAIIEKLVRIPSGLRAAQLLLDSGFFQEQGTLQRVIDEIQEDVIFLCTPILFNLREEIHDEYLAAFFAEEFDMATGPALRSGQAND